jgi:hypothetical protein
MLDFDKATKILTEHFANLTPDEFEVNLRKYCPELYPEVTDNLDLDNIKDTNLYKTTPAIPAAEIVKIISHLESLREQAPKPFKTQTPQLLGLDADDEDYDDYD